VARLSHAPTSSNELSSDVSSSFVEDVPSSPPVEPSSLTNSSPEQLIKRNHRLRRPLTITLLLLLHPLLFLS
jgi:hypothetical protein